MKTKIELLRKQVDDLKSIAFNMINKSLQNTESLEDLQLKSERLVEQAKVFKKRSTQLKDKYFWIAFKQRIKLACLIVGAALFGAVCLLGGLSIIPAHTASLIACALIGLTMAAIEVVELLSKLQLEGALKNPFQFFAKKTERDESEHIPRLK